MSSSFLNLSDSVSQKGEGNKIYNEGSLETAANMDSQTKHDFGNIQDLKQQIVELKRQLSLKDQDLMYTKQRNEKLNNEVKNLQSSIPSNSKNEPNSNFSQIIEENGFLKEKIQEAESELIRMQEYIDEVLKDTEMEQMLELLRKEKESNEKLQKEKTELLEYVEGSLAEQEKITEFIESLQKDNTNLKEELDRVRSKQTSSKTESEKYDGDRQHFDTFGRDSEDLVPKAELLKAEEEIDKLREQVEQLNKTGNIKNKSRDTNIENLTQKLEISQRDKEEADKCIQEMESHFKNEIDIINKSFDLCKENLRKVTDERNEYQKQSMKLVKENEEINLKHKKINDNYNTLENT